MCHANVLISTDSATNSEWDCAVCWGEVLKGVVSRARAARLSAERSAAGFGWMSVPMIQAARGLPERRPPRAVKPHRGALRYASDKGEDCALPRERQRFRSRVSSGAKKHEDDGQESQNSLPGIMCLR